MTTYRWLTVLFACAMLLAPVVHAQAEPLENDVRDPSLLQPQAQGLCFDRPVQLGPIVIGGGCYEPYLVRTGLGGFLALVAPVSTSPVIAPGQTVLLDSLPGLQVWSRLRHLVALPVPLTALPRNSLHAVAVSVDRPAGRLIVPVPGTAGPISIGFRYR
ncbi:MAG: hypothetical protein ACT4PY_12740 [Armatimonadota bacterium]